IQGVWQGCYLQNDPTDCSLIQFGNSTFTETDPATGLQHTFRTINNVRALAFNGAAYTFKGFDIVSNWTTQLSTGGTFDVRLLAEHMSGQIFKMSATSPDVNIVGQTGTANSFLSDNQPTAKWTGSLTGNYAQGPWVFTGQMRFVSAGIMDYNAPNGLVVSNAGTGAGSAASAP